MDRILVIGSTAADVIINIEQLPKTGEDINACSQEITLGGCACNVSDILRLFGVPYTLVSPVGTGVYGDFVRSRLAEKEVVSLLPSVPEPNGCCYCFVEKSGERTFVCHRGAEYRFRREWLEQIDCSAFKHVYVCGLDMEDESGEVIMTFLEAHPQLSVLFAPGPRIASLDSALVSRMYRRKPLLHANREEARLLTGCSAPGEAAALLFQQTKNTAVITDGEKGSWYCCGSRPVHIPAVKPAVLADTIGAGDAHCGAFLAGIARGQDTEEAVRTANLVASLAVAQKGSSIDPQIFRKAVTARF